MDAGRNTVTLASPVGEALLDARPGDVVCAKLPGGRERILCVLEVISDGRAMPTDRDDRQAEAA
jgi:transcription elongation GreA/GreB family factor